MPPLDDRYVYPEEVRDGLDARKIYRRFEKYIATGRDLQTKYRSQIQLLVGFEIETYGGSLDFARRLIAAFKPDYIVGSVHHVENIGFDYSPEFYRRAAEAAGGMQQMYARYFDDQYEMIERLRPPVVGHFDLIRIFDPDYPRRLKLSGVAQRVRRNLEQIKGHDLILDLNLRALSKGASEPYPMRWILQQALEMGIAVVPGDDSHSADTAGLHIDAAIHMLQQLGADTNWRKPNIKRPAAG